MHFGFEFDFDGVAGAVVVIVVVGNFRIRSALHQGNSLVVARRKLFIDFVKFIVCYSLNCKCRRKCAKTEETIKI